MVCSWCLQQFFFLFLSNLTSFSRKSDKNRGFLHISPLYIKVGQILGLSKNGSWVLVDAHRFFFYGSWFRTCTGSFGDVPKYFGLLKEVGHIAKWWVFTEITFFGSNFFRSVIRAHTESFGNVSAGTSPLYIKVGQILWLSKNGSWDLVDAHRFFFQISCYLTCFSQKKYKKNVSRAFDNPNIKVGQMCDIWKNRPWSAVPARTSFFFDFFPIWPLFSRKSDKNRGLLHISPLYIKVG